MDAVDVHGEMSAVSTAYMRFLVLCVGLLTIGCGALRFVYPIDQIFIIFSGILTCCHNGAQVMAKLDKDEKYEYHQPPRTVTGFVVGWQFDIVRMLVKQVSKIAILVAVFLLQHKAVQSSGEFLDLLTTPEAFVSEHILPCSVGQSPAEWRQLCFCKGAPIAPDDEPLCPSCDISQSCHDVIATDCLCDATLYGGTCGEWYVG